MADLLALYARVAKLPYGRALFSRLVARRAPYFESIAATITTLELGRCEAQLRKRRAVQNHIGTVHAIAMCNLCELAAGVLIEATLPKTLRWIPKGMTVRYLKKAGSDLVGTAEWTPDLPAGFNGEVVLPVRVRDVDGIVVMEADITMQVSPKPARN